MAMDSKCEVPWREYADKPGWHAYGPQTSIVRLSHHIDIPSVMEWAIVFREHECKEADAVLLTAVAYGNSA